MPWIVGYLPAKNIGTTVKEKMITLLHTSGIEFLEPFIATADPARLARDVTALRQQTLATRPLGSFQPAMVSTIATSYVRDPAVKAWVLQVSNGRCESCYAPAPFMGGDGLPYLEVHHVMPLSSHGSDTTANAAALCPNCHRRCHSSIDRDEFKLALYQKLPADRHCASVGLTCQLTLIVSRLDLFVVHIQPLFHVGIAAIFLFEGAQSPIGTATAFFDLASDFSHPLRLFRLG
jgi:5-methylcytosine-specific restriction endonuclease McrA